MHPLTFAFTLFSIVAGQLLFKLVSAYAKDLNGVMELILFQSSIKNAIYLYAAFCLYATASVAWIIVLSSSTLSKAYGMLALTYILVPALSFLLFQESFSRANTIGYLLIGAGVFMTQR